ncbi:hypothetical protein GPECTOR_109g196 [Gonium pectorale]|uniref:Uncharacterized protein n=1 Tax=Gonium pectorale TaxID=33097 RepID=A0A150FZB2_GONPE|nr:hypothetical protein GPECTOR_109g196 [Gonium pectorale]|eukprot:KXZ42953.1 hypothetical protein GPECTOR_109g196 [Gonium pectorale]
MPTDLPLGSGRRLWTMAKLWMALRDVPEVGILALLGTGALAMGAYTYGRMMFTPAGESFPSVEVRRDPDKQVAAVAGFHNPSFFYRVAQWKSDDKGFNIGVFDNRYRPFEYNLPTQGTVHSGLQYETGAAAKPAPM